MHENLILISEDAESRVSIIPPEGDTIARIAYEVLISNPYQFTEAEYHHEVHITRRNRPDLNISSYSIKRSPLLQKFGWGVHRDVNGRLALVPAESEEYQNFSNSIATSNAYRISAS